MILIIYLTAVSILKITKFSQFVSENSLITVEWPRKKLSLVVNFQFFNTPTAGRPSTRASHTFSTLGVSWWTRPTPPSLSWSTKTGRGEQVLRVSAPRTLPFSLAYSQKCLLHFLSCHLSIVSLDLLTAKPFWLPRLRQNCHSNVDSLLMRVQSLRE